VQSLYLASGGPYPDAGNPERVLAERIESVVSQEHAKWAGTQSEAANALRSLEGQAGARQ
jgi:hypothetical protein